jgi:lambda family phage portal protein
VIGAGLQIQPRPDWRYIGITEDEAAEFTQAAIREFDMFAESLESDYTGQACFNEQQALLFIQALYDGDVFFALPWVPSKRAGWPYETTVRIIDADLVRNPDDDWMSYNVQPTNAKIRNGIEYDSQGRLEAYWVANYYRNDAWGLDDSEKSFTRIPAYDANGERQIFHVLEHERHGQRRGMPLLAPVVDQLKMVSRLTKSELTSAIVASMFTVFIRDQSGLGGRLQEGFTPSETVDGGGGYSMDMPQEAKSESAPYNYELGPGNIFYLDPDKDISVAETRDKRDYDQFFQSMASLATSAIDLPLDQVLLVFNKSYSALKGTAIAAAQRFSMLRSVIGRGRIVRPVYEAVISEGVLKGRIPAPKFFDDFRYRMAWLRADAVGAGWGQLDPVGETKASILKINNNLSTHERQIALDQGGRWQPMVDQLASERRHITDSGLDPVGNLDSNGPNLEGVL